MTGEREQGGGIVLILLALSIAIALAPLSSPDAVPAYRDLLVFVLPFKQFLAESLRSGQLPLWNPWIYLGTPFLGSLQSGVLYPPSALLLLPFPLGFNVFLLFHFLVAMAGMWRLLRDRDLPMAAAAIGTLTFGLGGYLISTINVTNNLQAVAWAPWAVLLWRRYLRGASSLSAAGLLASLSLELLGGAPEVLILTVIMMSLWTVHEAGFGRAMIASQVHLASALVLVGGLTAYQILPTAETIAQSDRGHALSYDEVATWSLQPVSLIQLLYPHSASLDTVEGVSAQALAFERIEPWIHSIYLGVVPLIFAVSGAAAGAERAVWLALLLGAGVLALGSHAPVFPALYHLAPWLVGKFRYPEKFFFLVHFAASVLAAEGAAAILRDDPRGWRAARAAAATFIAISATVVAARQLAPGAYLEAIVVLTGTFGKITSYVPLAVNVYLKALRALLWLGGFVAVAVLRRMGLLGAATAGALVVTLVGADLALTHYDLNSTISWSATTSAPPYVDVAKLRAERGKLFLYQTVSDPLPGEPQEPIAGLERYSTVRGRFLGFDQFARLIWRLSLLDIPMMQQIETLSGADGISRDSDNEMRNALNIVPRERALKILRVLGVTTLLGPSELDVNGLEPIDVRRTRPYFGYRLSQTVPPAYVASRVIAAPTTVEAFNHIIGNDFREGADATVEAMPAELADRPGAARGSVRIDLWENERIVLAAHSDGPALLVLNHSFFPGWEATIDDRPAAILRANAIVRGVALPGGHHRIEFRYRPRSLRLGLAVSAATLLACALLAWRRSAAYPSGARR